MGVSSLSYAFHGVVICDMVALNNKCGVLFILDIIADRLSKVSCVHLGPEEDDLAQGLIEDQFGLIDLVDPSEGHLRD